MRRVSALCIGVSLFACTNEVSELESGQICGDPISKAGDDQTVQIGTSVTLDGASSSWCDDYSEELILTWLFVSTPANSNVNEESLSGNRNAAAITPQFTPDTTGEYVLSLQVNDGVTVSNIDYVVISVVAGGDPPVADCGGSYQGDIGSIVTIDGSASSASVDLELDYAWSLNTPPCSALTTADVYNASTATPSFVPDCEGTYAVSLAVSDGSYWSDPVVCSVEVGSSNRLPVADAGSSETLGGCATDPFRLNGYSSYDADGDTLSYVWTLVSSPSGSATSDESFDDPSSATPTFTWDIKGTYTFQLQVYDGQNWSAPDLVDFNIGDIEDNRRPIANAGDAVAIEVVAACQNTSYSSECLDCPPYTILLDGSATVDLDGDALEFSWSESTGGLEIATPGAAVSNAVIPSQAVSTTLSFEASLNVSDCERSDSDAVTITYSCISDLN